MAKKTGNKSDRLHERTSDLEAALLLFSSNLYSFLVKDVSEFRFLKVSQRDTDDYLAVIGIFGDDGSPMVAFGNGPTFVTALMSLGATVTKDQWRDDKFAGK